MNAISIEVWKELFASLILVGISAALVFVICISWLHQNRKWETRKFLRRRNPDLPIA